MTKCREKDCKDCVHFINIRTHPLWSDFVIKDESGKTLQFEGCNFHLQTMFLRQLWVRAMGVQEAVELNRNETMKSIAILAQGLNNHTKSIEKELLGAGKSDGKKLLTN